MYYRASENLFLFCLLFYYSFYSWSFTFVTFVFPFLKPLLNDAKEAGERRFAAPEGIGPKKRGGWASPQTPSLMRRKMSLGSCGNPVAVEADNLKGI